MAAELLQILDLAKSFEDETAREAAMTQHAQAIMKHDNAISEYGGFITQHAGIINQHTEQIQQQAKILDNHAQVLTHLQHHARQSSMANIAAVSCLTIVLLSVVVAITVLYRRLDRRLKSFESR